MKNEERALTAIKKLEIMYPDAKCSLIYETPLQLLIAIRLSAQCTDKMVNMVTPALFDRFKSLDDFAKADPKVIEKYIYSCGFYRTKSKDIIEMCNDIICKFNREIPKTLEDLISLPGIGRKTANLFLGEMYEHPAIIVDTHFIRITNRLGFHNTKDAFKIEKLMKKLIPPEKSLKFCHRVIMHGRLVCNSRSPLCKGCGLNEICKKYIDKL